MAAALPWRRHQEPAQLSRLAPGAGGARARRFRGRDHPWGDGAGAISTADAIRAKSFGSRAMPLIVPASAAPPNGHQGSYAVMQRPRLIVGISGATGTVYGIRFLQVARALEVETHLVITKAGERTLAFETDVTIRELRSMADHSYPDTDIGAAIASGSFLTIGMIVAPCSVHSLAEIAHSTTDGLLTR